MKIRLNKKILIFLNNKLITVDTLIPIILSLKNKNKNIKFYFYTLDAYTKKEIKKNLVLYNAIKSAGKIDNLGLLDSKYFHKYLLKIFRIIHIFFIFGLSVFSNTKIIHFGFFEHSLTKILYKISNIKFYFFEANCWGYNRIMRDFQLLKRDRPINEVLEKKNFLVGFSKNWPALKQNKKCKRIIITPSRLWPEWQSFINFKKDYFLKEGFLNNKIKENKNNILLVLGYLGKIDFYSSDKSAIILLEKTLRLLSEFSNNINIILKPHAITDIKKVEQIIKKNNYKNFYISYLHVGLIAKFCKISISNYYSLALIDAYFSGSTTIEFSDYSKEALKVSRNQSVIKENISYFINSDEKKLRKLISKLLKNNQSRAIQLPNFSHSKNDLKLINILSS